MPAADNSAGCPSNMWTIFHAHVCAHPFIGRGAQSENFSGYTTLRASILFYSSREVMRLETKFYFSS